MIFRHDRRGREIAAPVVYDQLFHAYYFWSQEPLPCQSASLPPPCSRRSRVAASAQDTKPGDPAPLQLTAQQDHKLMMEALKIGSLRRGADGRPNAANPANYDESKANPYPDLPDPLTLKNGEKVTTPDQWWSKRRPEIVEDFDREVYGRVPTDVPLVKWEVTGTTAEKVGDVAVVTKRLIGPR